MIHLESTMEAPHLTNQINLEEETLVEICDWISNLDRTIEYEPLNIGDKREMNELIVEVEYFLDEDVISIRDTETDHGVMLSVEELLSKYYNN